MPSLHIVSPVLDPDVKSILARRLTAEFARIAKFEPELFGIHFDGYESGDVAIGGRIWDNVGTPFLHFLLFSPRLKKSVKKEIVSSFTTIFVEVTGHSDWEPVFHLNEHPYDSIGVGGELLSNKYPELSKRSFYYQLPDD